MDYTYRTCGTCSRAIHLDIADGVIRSVSFEGGCNGNLQGIAALVKGKKPAEVVALLSGIRCGSKPTSCPDQLAHALEEYERQQLQK